MDRQKVVLTIVEAKRFIDKAEAFLIESKKTYTNDYNGKTHIYSVSTPKESGATKRASMDLTRALAELRKP